MATLTSALADTAPVPPTPSGLRRTALAGLPELQERAELDRPREVPAPDARELSRALFVRLRELEEGTPEYSYVRGTLIELNVSLVRFAVRRFSGSREPHDDIVQAGTVGLIKAIDRFEPERGLEFTTFAVPTIVGEVKRYFRDGTWAVHVPRRLQEARLAVVKGSDELEQRLDRSPTVAELAEHLGFTPAEVLEGLGAAEARTANSLEARLDDGAEGEGPGLEAQLGAEDPRFERIDAIEALKPTIAALPERDRLLLALRFGEELTQSQIGERLGVSQMHVSRLLTRVLAELRAVLVPESP
ncbi:SigB/SigF/SigG family RNA polymerase sigma factor [Kitasatospora sp. NPDC096147]|uniref:SigB/SigF/SigG family RNA polymerase sigma factor n=1 Tax=Kitasatospora sp. NPDC096147 TaxID=3364093 RepID=UPI0037F11987